jgi:hypothetical protein
MPAPKVGDHTVIKANPQKTQTESLTVLPDGSKDSIYNLIGLAGGDKNEQPNSRE